MNSLHRKRFFELLNDDKTHNNDWERYALFYIISGNSELYSCRNSIYDFNKSEIIVSYDEQTEKVYSSFLQSGVCVSSKALVRAGFNLYNSFKDDLDSLSDLFYSLDEENTRLLIEAISLRFLRFDSEIYVNLFN